MAKATRSTAVVAIVGGDSFRAEAALDQVLQKAVGKERGDDSVQVFRGDETTWTRIVDAARTGSLFVAQRAVVVRGAELVKGEGEELLAFLQDPPPDVTLVLVARPDKRKTLWKRIVDGATCVDAEPLKGRALRSFVADEIRRRGLRLDEHGLEEILDRVGQDLRRLMGELDKLEAYAGDRKALSADDVAKVLGRGMAQPLYKLADAMMSRQPTEVLGLVHSLLEDGEPALKMLATMHRAIRQMRVARALVTARVPRDEFASRLGIPPFKTGDVIDASRLWSEPQLRTAIQALSRADLRIKTGSDAGVALAVMVAEACGPARRPAR